MFLNLILSLQVSGRSPVRMYAFTHALRPQSGPNAQNRLCAWSRFRTTHSGGQPPDYSLHNINYPFAHATTIATHTPLECGHSVVRGREGAFDEVTNKKRTNGSYARGKCLQ